jgi:uncharacterized membrane protein (UPF0127 family)
VTFALVLLLVSLTAGAQSIGDDPSASIVPVQFEKRRLTLAGKSVTVEVADTFDRRERGLMFRKSLADNTGMLFIFPNEQRVAFWMKNTLIPLSIGYFDKARILKEVHEMEPAVMGEKSPKTYPSSVEVLYALEMPKEWFKRHRIKPGSRFILTEQKQK